MNDCLSDKQLSSFIACELSNEQNVVIEKHLSKCEHCRNRLYSIEKRTAPLFPLPSKPFSCFSDMSVPSHFEDKFFQFINTETSLELPQIIGFYRIYKVIGRGGMGILYEGEHLLLHRKVAIKFIRHKRLLTPAMTELFQREIITAGKLSHPNIVAALDAGTFNEQMFLVMELLDGMNMGEYVQKFGKMSLKDAVQVISQAAAGLSHAHKVGLIHCDIKPSNLWKCPDGTVKILDLGLMQLNSALNNSAPHHGGTPHFMSPEQIAKSNQITEKTDIYSLGCTFYFLLTGKIPSENDPNCFNLKNTGLKPWKRIQKILNKMTHQEEAQRYDSMDSVIKDLNSCSKRLGPTWLVILGYFFMFTSLLVLPPIFGALAIMTGFKNKKRGNSFHGEIQIRFGILCTSIGIILGVLNTCLHLIEDTTSELHQEIRELRLKESDSNPQPLKK